MINTDFYCVYCNECLASKSAFIEHNIRHHTLHCQKMREEKVDHPSHYGGADNAYEAIKIIEAHQLNFSRGNVIKYTLRAAHKGAELEDLKKAAWYLNREIENCERTKETK